MINRRYTILRPLGKGGSGEVFLVDDTLDASRRIALKVLHPPGFAGSVDAEQFRREVSLVLGLNHPHLMQITESGTVFEADEPGLEGRLFFTMEFVDGADALHWSRRLPDGPPRLSALLSLLLQCLAALEYLHREGVIHHDIKPENLMVIGGDDDPCTPTLKLMDFGFSRHDQASERAPLRGTLQYMAPELLRGEGADRRADLYSLGATFYHLIEGSPAFDASTPADLVKSILTQSLRFRSSDIPGMVDLHRVILRLLAKDPADRFACAKDVATALLEFAQYTLPEHPGVTAKPRFVGRDEELRRVSASLDALQTTLSRKDTVGYCFCGADGMGKTALLDRLTRLARGKGHLTYEVPRGIREVPLSGALPVLNKLEAELLCRSSDSHAIARKYAGVLAEARHTSGNVSTAAPSTQKTEILAHMVLEASTIVPLVLTIDDFAERDEQTAQWVSVINRDCQAARVLLLVTTDAPSNSLPFSLEQWTLKELTTEEIAAMCISVWGDAPLVHDLALRLSQLYGGLPGLIVEALGALVKTLTSEALRDDEVATAILNELSSLLPKGIDEFFLARYRQYHADCQKVLDGLSCFSHPVPVETAMALVPLPRPRLRAAMNDLLADGVLSASDLSTRVGIRQDRMRIAVHEVLGGAAQDLHRAAAMALEQTVDKPTLLDLQELGQQCVAGGLPDVASRYLAEAARAAIHVRAYQKATDLFGDAIACAPPDEPPERRLLLRKERAEALRCAGSYHEAASSAEELLTVRRGLLQDMTAVYRTLGLSLQRLGRYDEAKYALLEALNGARDLITRLRIRQEIASIEIALGDFAQAEEYCRQHLPPALETGDNLLIATIHTNLGITAFYQNKLDEAVASFRVALDAYVRADQPIMLVDTLNNIGNALSAQGNHAAAVQYWSKALLSSREIGTYYQQAQIQNNLGIAHYNLKRYDQAKKYYATARDIFKRIASQSGQAFTLTNLGEVLFAECEYEPALNCWGEALVLYKEMDDAIGMTESNLQIGEVSIVLGQYAGAEEALRAAEQTIKDKGLLSFEDRFAFLHGLLSLREGRADEARTLFQRASERYRDTDKREKMLVTELRIAECDMALGHHDAALARLQKVLDDRENACTPLVSAETHFLLGTLARSEPSRAPKHPLTYFKQGWESITEEPVCELTWKLSFALGREYHERGQPERSRDYLLRTKVVINFLASHFADRRLRDHYLLLEHKDKVLTTIHALQ